MGQQANFSTMFLAGQPDDLNLAIRQSSIFLVIFRMAFAWQTERSYSLQQSDARRNLKTFKNKANVLIWQRAKKKIAKNHVSKQFFLTWLPIFKQTACEVVFRLNIKSERLNMIAKKNLLALSKVQKWIWGFMTPTLLVTGLSLTFIWLFLYRLGREDFFYR